MRLEETGDAAIHLPDPRGSIVVGHDGSAGSGHALAAALGLAEQLNLPVVVVRAWSIATAPRPSTWAFGYVPSFQEYSEAVREELVRDSRAIVGDYFGLQVSYHAVHAHPVRTLMALSQDARMLVVGSRGKGALAGMLLGSVSEKCARHAACPVLIVPAPAAERGTS